MDPRQAQRWRRWLARAQGRASTGARHVVSIATAGLAAQLSHAPRTLKVRGHLCGNTNFPRYGGSDGPLLSHCAGGRPPALRGEERAWLRVPGIRAAGPTRRRTAPRLPIPPLRAQRGRLGTRRGSGHRGARLLEGDPRRRGGQLWACRKQTIAEALESGGLCPKPSFCQTSPYKPRSPGLRPQRPSALHL